jgi:DMSO/TMAO reductase YedYZ molybdopterin-dependent catalytic subunit
MPETSVTATIECAGNGRVFLTPKVDGAQWERGAVGNAVWTGVRLAEVLQRAGLNPSVREVILTGADRGEIESAPKPGGEIHYARSLPVAKASDDVLLAWQMNGQDLTSAHGFPVRAIVPGWYGMASVKWLSEITAITQPFHGYYQSVDYAYWQRVNGEPSLVPITELQVKAQIARPGPAERVPVGQSYLVRGSAWSGEAEVTRVEFSPDGGKTWHETRLGENRDRHAWRRWDFPWQPEQRGRATLMVRATDAKGRTQPARRDADRGAYMINEVLGIDVSVE